MPDRKGKCIKNGSRRRLAHLLDGPIHDLVDAINMIYQDVYPRINSGTCYQARRAKDTIQIIIDELESVIRRLRRIQAYLDDPARLERDVRSVGP